MAVTSKASNQLMTKADVIELINNAILTQIDGSGQSTLLFMTISSLDSAGFSDGDNKFQVQGSKVGVNTLTVTVDGTSTQIK